ncbi:uncharacterized protein FSUBG_10345 [Fusarium subglutinans]|uniref:Uncharacterized protein n=1 Tax=Gibberella subglutinans TaxID=42677 RepID=A0A8H5UJU7_GIBSU|nr:uncharacterized protein FSUBG_10345 [Fusarium subglutinans]KAF5591901.1 hypothetical protein FSUBG_10345 [Fusarium subglutinans]
MVFKRASFKRASSSIAPTMNATCFENTACTEDSLSVRDYRFLWMLVEDLFERFNEHLVPSKIQNNRKGDLIRLRLVIYSSHHLAFQFTYGGELCIFHDTISEYGNSGRRPAIDKDALPHGKLTRDDINRIEEERKKMKNKIYIANKGEGEHARRSQAIHVQGTGQAALGGRDDE